jgi:hypothetical protein
VKAVASRRARHRAALRRWRELGESVGLVLQQAAIDLWLFGEAVIRVTPGRPPERIPPDKWRDKIIPRV